MHKLCCALAFLQLSLTTSKCYITKAPSPEKQNLNVRTSQHLNEVRLTNELGKPKQNQTVSIIKDDTELQRTMDSQNVIVAGEVRVLCWVMTCPENHMTKAVHVKATWGKRCDKLLFMSTAKDPDLPAVKLPVKEGRDFLWGKTKAAFTYVYKHYRHEADWFLKADDDTFVVVENLRSMLAWYSPEDLIYFGCRFKSIADIAEKKNWTQGFMSGGAGYVLSRAALDKLVTAGLPTPALCEPSDEGTEDVEMGICLEQIGVKAMDSRDSLLRNRFYPFMPEECLFKAIDKSFWYWEYLYYPSDDNAAYCSDFIISFHYVKPEYMYILEYLLYHLRPNKNRQITVLKPDKKLEKKQKVLHWEKANEILK